MKFTKEEKVIVDQEIKTAVEQACQETGITDPETKAMLEKATYAVLAENTPIYKTLGAPDKIMKTTYSLGYNLYKSGSFKKALVVFRTLLRVDGLNPHYYYAIAASHHQLKEYEAASNYYFTAAYLDPDNPIPCYHMHDCCMKLKDPYSAAYALGMVIERSKKNPKFHQLLEIATLSQEKIINNIKNKEKSKTTKKINKI